MADKQKNRLFNLPNSLSLLRILCIPVFMILIFNRKTFWAFVTLFAAGISDVLDGIAARVRHEKTKFGALLDPAADKLLMTASFIVLSFPALNSPHVIPLWLTVIVIGRDVFIVSGAFALYKWRGQKSFPPSITGKASTVCQVTVVLLVLLFNVINISTLYLNWLYLATSFLTILSAIHYTVIGLRMISSPRRGSG